MLRGEPVSKAHALGRDALHSRDAVGQFRSQPPVVGGLDGQLPDRRDSYVYGNGAPRASSATRRRAVARREIDVAATLEVADLIRPAEATPCLNHQKLALPADDVPCVFRN